MVQYEVDPRARLTAPRDIPYVAFHETEAAGRQPGRLLEGAHVTRREIIDPDNLLPE